MKAILIATRVLVGFVMGYFLTPKIPTSSNVCLDCIDTQVISRADTERERGNWGVLDKYTYDQACTCGDLLYASPWRWHGVHNTDLDTMTFFFLKWNNKGVAAPAEPEGAHVQQIIDRIN